MNSLPRLIVFTALLATPVWCVAADRGAFAGFSITSWSAEDGLPSPGIRAIAQDQAGYLWLATAEGVVRFDGVHFTPWDLISTHKLPDSFVSVLRVSRDGSLWIGFGDQGGVSRFHHGVVSSFGSNDGLPPGGTRALLEDREGTVWVGSFGGLARYRDGRWERLAEQHGLPRTTTVDSVYEDRNGTLWAATSAGVLRRNPQSDAFESTAAGSYRARDLIEDGAGAVWVTGQPLPFRRLASVGSLPSKGPAVSAVYGYRLLRDRHERLWVATLGQGLIFVPGVPWDTHPVAHFTQQTGLTSDWVSSVFEDREQNIWVGTERGLHRLTATTNRIVTMPGFAQQTVRAVTVTKDGSLWTGTADGLHRSWNGKSRWYREDDGLPSATIRVLHSASDGTLWVATGRGPVRFANGRFSPIVVAGDIRLERINAMTADLRGNLWLCDFTGVYRWREGRLAELDLEFGGTRGTPPSAIHADREGRVWIGFSGGGLVVHQDNVSIQYSDRHGLSAGAVTAIYEDPAGTIWASTSQGLSMFSGSGFVSVPSAALGGGRITGLVEDSKGDLWLATNLGLVRLQRDEFLKATRGHAYPLQYRRFGPNDGLDARPIAQGQPTSTRDNTGTLWFVTSSGLTAVNPDVLAEHSPPAEPLVERILADEQPFALQSPPRLPAGTARIQIDYTSLTLASSSTILFRYKLDGYDQLWIDAGHRRQAFYTNLPPRDYRFRVAASHGDGRWRESGSTAEFSIAPAFFQTSWFYILCSGMAVVSLWGAWQLRLRQVQKKFAVVLGERERLAREIHDTLLQGMLGVALQLHGVSEAMETSPGTWKQRCQRARDNLEYYVRETRLSIWDLRAPSDQRQELPGALQEAIERVAGPGSPDVSLTIIGRPQPCGEVIEKNVLRIGQEAISNAVRHADASHVSVQLSYEPTSLRLRISDDGRGFDPEAAQAVPPHWGLRSMRERIEQLGGQWQLISHPGAGTEIRFTIPRAATP